jgi:hypothetical protein
MGAVVGAAAGDRDAPDRGFAGEAGLAGALVDAVLELEKAAYTFGVDIIGNRGTAEANGVLQDFAEGEPQTFEFDAGEASGTAAGANTGTKEALVGVDVAYTGEELLVVESGLDGEPAAVEEGCELGRLNAERFGAGCYKSRS